MLTTNTDQTKTANMQADLSLFLAHISDGIFSQFAAHIISPFNPCPAE